MDWTKVGLEVGQILVPLLLAGLTWAATKLAQWIGQKVTNEQAAGVLQRLDGLVVMIVREILNTMVDSAKASSADGKLPKEVASNALAAALAKLKSYIGMDGLKILAAVLGMNPEDKRLDEFLTTKIESAISAIKDAKDGGSAAGALTGTFEK